MEYLGHELTLDSGWLDVLASGNRGYGAASTSVAVKAIIQSRTAPQRLDSRLRKIWNLEQ